MGTVREPSCFQYRTGVGRGAWRNQQLFVMAQHTSGAHLRCTLPCTTWLPCRRGRAYHGLGRLQEALRDFEAAEAGAEAEGDIKHKHDVTK